MAFAQRVVRSLAAVLVCSTLVLAHEGEPTEAWRWSRFTTRSGLPSNQVEMLVEGGDGTPWVGTRLGLAWYDGFRWNPAHEVVPGQAPTSLAVQPDGRVVVVVAERLFVGDQHGFEEVRPDFDGLPVVPRQALPLPDGSLLVRESVTNLLLRWSQSGRSETLRRPEPFPERPEPQLWAAPDGDVYMNASSGLYRWSDGTWAPWIRFGRQNLLFVVAEGPDGTGIAAVARPRERFDAWTWSAGGVPRKLSSLDESGACDVAVSRSGELAIAHTDDRVTLFAADGERSFQLPHTLHTIRCVSFRANGDLWIGSKTGLFLYRRTSQLWQTLVAPGTREPAGVHELLAASDGTLWVATTEGLERWRDGRFVDAITEVLGIAIDRPTALGEDRLGRIWVGSGASFSGCLRWDGERWAHVGDADGLGADHVHKIRKDRDGRLWFLGMHHDNESLSGPGAFALEDDGGFTRWSPAHGRVYDFEQGPDGALWFATFAGLSRFREGEWTHWTTADGLQIERVFALAIEESGRVWFGHQEWSGLGFIDRDRVAYDSRDLPNQEVWELLVDAEERLWVGTSNGVSVQRGDARISFAEDAGLDRARVWPILPLGDRVYFGTLNAGLVALHLDQADLAPPCIVIDEPRNDGRRKTVHWEASAPEGWVPQDAVRTRFRFGNEPWSEWGLTREGQVPDVDTTLTVQALGFLGDYDAAGTIRALRRPRPLYRTPIFIVPIALLSASVLVLVLALYARKRRHARELRSSELRYRELFENANDMIFTSDLSGRMHAANRKTREVLGIATDEVEGLRLEELAAAEHQERYRVSVAKVLATGSSGLYELDLSTPSGKQASLEINTRLVHENGAPQGMQSVARDVTGRREHEVEQRQAHKMEALGVLAGGVAHDFNNALSVILGYSDILLERIGDEGPFAEDLLEIRKAGERGASLTRQLLAFSRKQMQRVEVFDLGALAVDMEPMLRSLLGEDIELVIERADGCATLELDPGQVQQVILNLAANARDVMPTGGRLTIAIDTVEVGAEDSSGNEGTPPGAYVRLIVTDTGPGMDGETQRRVFDPFFTTKDVGKGTGLGLSSAYGIVQQSGGRIFVRSTLGAGARFHVLMQRTDKLPRTEYEERPEARGGPETILVVEDEKSVRAIMADVLRSRGYTTFEAGDASQAQRIARDLGGSIDLLVTDVVMPGLSGPELAERLTSAYPGLRVLYVSGYTGDALLKRGAPVDHDFLAKPFGVNEFARKVDEVFGRTAAAADPSR